MVPLILLFPEFVPYNISITPDENKTPSVGDRVSFLCETSGPGAPPPVWYDQIGNRIPPSRAGTCLIHDCVLYYRTLFFCKLCSSWHSLPEVAWKILHLKEKLRHQYSKATIQKTNANCQFRHLNRPLSNFHHFCSAQIHCTCICEHTRILRANCSSSSTVLTI